MSIPLIDQEDVLETSVIKRTQRIHHEYKDDISFNCHLSKNLWNQAHHLIDGYYNEYGYVPSYEELDAILNKKTYKGYKKKDDKDGKVKYNPDFDNYHKLGATSQQILKVYIKSWISYLKDIKEYWENCETLKLKKKKENGETVGLKYFTGMPRKPGYKKKDGEFELIFSNGQIKFRENKNGNIWMYFPKNKGKGLKGKDGKPLKILLGNINDIDSYLINRLLRSEFDQVRIIPKGTGYWIEIVYDQEVLKNASEIYGLDENKIETIDTGVENLSAITDNIGTQPIVIKSEICVQTLKL